METETDTDTKITKKHTKEEIHANAVEILNKPLFMIRLNYKSGYTEIFAFHSFSIEGHGFHYEVPHNIICNHLDVSENILLFNADEIEAVIQVKSHAKTSEVINGEYLEQTMTRKAKDQGSLAD